MDHPQPAIRKTWSKVYLRVPVIYATVAVVWILFSDQILFFFVNDAERLTRLQILKGWFFVSVTALLLFFLLKREVGKLEASHRALAQSEAKFKAIFNQTFQFVGLLKPDGTMLAANDTALAFAGLSDQTVIGKPFWETPWWRNSSTNQERLRDAIDRAAAGHFVRFETTNVGQTGEILDIDFSLKPVYGKDGKVLYLIPEGRDITERKKAESELVAYRAHLEELVEERTIDLRRAQDELLQKERLATLGQLTSTVSHELRNPLGSISNAIYSLEQSIDSAHRSDQIQRSFQFAGRNIQRCVMVIDQLLDFAAEKHFYFEAAELDSFLSKWLESWPKPSGVSVRARLEAGAVVRLDLHHFSEALEKVLANAVEAMEGEVSGGSEIDIATQTEDSSVRIQIRDTGPGIPEPLLDRVHEPLFSTKGFGVGLGIPYAQDIIRKHSGEMAIESEEGAGTIVTIRLPLASGETVNA